MALPQYPEVNDLDELFGFSAARQRAEAAAENTNFYEEPSFIQHRVFLNQVDTFNAKYISSYLTDQIYGANKKGGGGEEGEAEGEEEAEAEQAQKQPKTDFLPQMKYEIIGTLHKSFHKKTEDILFTLAENDENFMENIMKCGFIVYDITKDPSEMPKALNTLSVIEGEIEKLKELGPKTFKSIEEVRVFILISTVMTWSLTKPLDPEEPDLPFTEADYKKRRAHPNYTEHIACEREVVLKGRKNKDKLKTYVIASGIIYGAEEDDLTFLFKLAWNNEKELPIFQSGKNSVPLIHIKDLAKVIHGVTENRPSKQYILAVEQLPSKLKQIIKALSKTMGSGRTKDVAVQEAFLYSDITQTLFERYTVNLIMEPGIIVEEFEIEWQNEQNLFENMGNIVNEFKKTRNLLPIRVIIHGPPAVGKTRIAKQLSEYYGAHYFTVKSVIEEHMHNLQETIEREKAKIEAKEEKAKALEEGGKDADEEAAGEEEEEEEEEEIDIEELGEQIKEIETAMAESEDGKLPDDQVNQLMKTFLLSNRCNNQGYIVDGYPKTIEQAKSLFGGGEGGGEEEAGEEEGEEGEGGGNKLLPEFVISLEATDEFLCERIMALPEREIQDTHYTEEGMVRRLATFRANNTEDNTMLNFFNETEIHPIVINAMDDTTETMENIMYTIKTHLGTPVSFGLTAEEEEELIRLEEERQKLLEKEAEMKKDSKIYQCSSLWAKYSMIKKMLLIKKNLDISKYCKLVSFLKSKSSGHEPKKAKVLSKENVIKFMTEAPDDTYLLTKLLEREAVADYQTKMEQWTATLEQLQLEEEKVLVAHGEPLRHYLLKFIFPTLSKGLLEVARMKPDDPVDFLAEYLFRENPEGHMFDPSYTRDGKRIMESYEKRIAEEVARLAVKDT